MLRAASSCIQRLLGLREEQLIAIRIVDLKRVVSPPGFLGGNSLLEEVTAKRGEPVCGQLDKQAPFVAARCVFTENDLALSVIDLADLPGAVACMPSLVEAKPVDVEANRAVHVGNEENRARVPPVNRLTSRGLLCHCAS